MTITYERVYFGDRRADEPSAELRRAAEAQIEMLHPGLRAVLSTTRADGSNLRFGPLAGSTGWIVTYTPSGDPPNV